MTENELLAGLNPEQVEVVRHNKGPLLAAAVAGAGKTLALVKRMAYLVQILGVDPRRILAVTFSKKGADEMSERLVAMIGDVGARVGTFHSVALEIIRKENPEFLDWTVDDKDRYRYCVKDAAGWMNMKWEAADISRLVHFISVCKASYVGPYDEQVQLIAERFVKQANEIPLYQEAYKIAERLRRERQLLTFDDFLFEAVDMFLKDESIRQRWASQWDYVLQDEAQDQNYVQLLMGELLARDHKNYMLVGDPAQTIFTWRGAQPEKLLGFEQSWTANVVKMGRNYRCGRKIIGYANKALAAMDPKTRLEMEMICCRDGVEGQVVAHEYANLDDEGSNITQFIRELHEDGIPYHDMVILFRTNAQSRAPEEALLSGKIPYQVIGSTNFYERKEIKDLIAYLRLIEGRGGIDDLIRCINSPNRYLGKVFKEHAKEIAKKVKPFSVAEVLNRTVHSGVKVYGKQKQAVSRFIGLIDLLATRAKAEGAEDSTPSRIIEQILEDTDYVKWLKNEEGEESPENSRVTNVRELVRAASRFLNLTELLDYIDETVKASKKAHKNGEKADKVTLTTLHRSKGLEWPVVFVIGVADSILPHGRAEDPEEERRLFYVGITRAKDRLFLSTIKEASFGNKVIALSPSPYFEEIGLEIQGG